MLLALAFAALAVLVGSHRNAVIISSDGMTYLRLKGQWRPFHLRWLMPALLRRNIPAWHTVTVLSALASSALVYAMTGSAVASWLWVWLFVVQNAAARPVLVDMASCALALGAALAVQRGHLWLGIALSLLSGACKESGPVFAAAWTLNPWLLVGVAAAAWWRTPHANDHPTITHPWSAAWQKHDLLDWRTMLAPWGALIVLAPLGMAWDRLTLAAVVSLCLGYAQLLRAQDDARLYLWAAPALLPLAVRAETTWLMPLLAVHPFAAVAEGRKVKELRRRCESSE